MKNKIVFQKGEFLSAEKMNRLARQAASAVPNFGNQSVRRAHDKAIETCSQLGSHVDYLATMPLSSVPLGDTAGVYAVSPAVLQWSGYNIASERLARFSKEAWKENEIFYLSYTTDYLGAFVAMEVKHASSVPPSIVPDYALSRNGLFNVPLGRVEKWKNIDGGDGVELVFYQWRVGYEQPVLDQAPSTWDYATNCPDGAARVPTVLSQPVGNTAVHAAFFEGGGIELKQVDPESLGVKVKAWMELSGEQAGTRFDGAVPPDGFYDAPVTVDTVFLKSPPPRWGGLSATMVSDPLGIKVSSPDAYHWRIGYDKEELVIPEIAPAPFTRDDSPVDDSWLEIFHCFENISYEEGGVPVTTRLKRKLYFKLAYDSSYGGYAILYKRTVSSDIAPEEVPF